MQNTAFGVWQNISGSGMLTALFLCALVFLFFQEKETYKRILLVYLPACWVGILFLPVTYQIIAGVIDEELYYRFFWMLPMTLVIAYALVQAYHLYQGAHKKLLAAGLALLLVLSGDFVYNNWRYSTAENKYHVPQSVADMCDLMHAEGREVMAVFPAEMMQYVRQYDSTVLMPYGRNVLVPDWKIDHPLYDIMEDEVLDSKALGEMAYGNNCMYVVVQEDKETTCDLTGALAEYGYTLKAEMHGYCVYYNDELFWAIYKQNQ
ncbi:MAG: hypothetical protein J6A10_07990 [Peptococcaceae bacterium]|nr:hypothetical protein [Peptococcaceae bacterium]